MKTPFKIRILFLFIMTIQLITAQKICVNISNIRNNKGQLCVAVFKNQSDFKLEKPCMDTFFNKDSVRNGEFKFEMTLKPGEYGLSVLDDENKSRHLEYTIIGIPKEGFGFSGFYLKGIRKPRFNDFSFVLGRNETKQIKICMKYFLNSN